ncbi:putative mitochondrial import inner membrane translocase subunit TIM22 [Helianthus anomalus]
MTNGKRNGFSTAVKELETLCKNWVEKPPLVVEAAVVTIVNGVQGALIREIFDNIGFRVASAYSVTPSQLKPPHWINARNTGVLIGAKMGIKCVMKKVRGKEDSQTRMIAGFGAGVLFSLVCGDPPAVVITSGVIVALVEEGYFKVKEKLTART